MKKLLLLFILTVAFNTKSQTTIPGGNVFGTWTLAGSPYLVQGHIIVPNDSTLTIDAGVVIQFQGHYKLFCNGRVLANGTITDSITFTAGSSMWCGFRYDGTPTTNDTSYFSYCKVEHGYAYSTSGGNDNYGGLFSLIIFQNV